MVEDGLELALELDGLELGRGVENGSDWWTGGTPGNWTVVCPKGA